VTVQIRQRLASVAVALRGGVALDADDSVQLAEALDRIAQGVAADVAFGLRRQRADMLAAIKARDYVLRDAAKNLPPSLTLAEAAGQLHRELSRYSASAWRRERLLDQCPARHRWEWQALRLRDAVPSTRSIRRVLANARF
jgi:hypothetical protein